MTYIELHSLADVCVITKYVVLKITKYVVHSTYNRDIVYVYIPVMQCVYVSQ